MAVNSKSKHCNAYYDHVLNKTKQIGSIGKVYDLINDMSDRRGLGDEFQSLDADIQDEIIDTWIRIIENYET